MNLEQEFTEKQKTAFSHAIFEYLYDNNEKRSIDAYRVQKRTLER